MGTIRIEEFSTLGTDANRDQPVHDLNALLKVTVDATTSATAESVTLQTATKLIRAHCVEDHRVVLGSDLTGTTYAFIPAGTYRDFGVPQGSTLYYRLDA